jgi:hypothetical protein
MSTPITYTTSQVLEDYAYTLKKYAISTGRPTTAGYTNYRDNPNSKTWYPAFIYNQYHPNGTGYYVISNNGAQGGHATAGNEIPTFHVTGNTDTAILHLINRLPNRGSNFYTSIDTAKAAIISDKETLHFDADLSKYNYYAPQFCLLNFDAGNLNCNYKSSDKDLRNLTNNAVASLNGVSSNPGSLNVSTDNASFYFDVDDSIASTISVTAGASSLDIDTADEYLVAMRVRFPVVFNGEILSVGGTRISLTYDGSNLILQTEGTNTNININIVTTNFATIIFGRATDGTKFLYVNDSNSELSNTSSGGTAISIPFSDLKLGLLGNTGNFYIGALQVWSGTGIDNAGVMSGVGQPDFFNQIHTMYAGRWS